MRLFFVPPHCTCDNRAFYENNVNFGSTTLHYGHLACSLDGGAITAEMVIATIAAVLVSQPPPPPQPTKLWLF